VSRNVIDSVKRSFAYAGKVDAYEVFEKEIYAEIGTTNADTEKSLLRAMMNRSKALAVPVYSSICKGNRHRSYTYVPTNGNGKVNSVKIQDQMNSR
jgi:hypothetical protein